MRKINLSPVIKSPVTFYVEPVNSPIVKFESAAQKRKASQ